MEALALHNLAIARHHLGELAEAVRLYREVLPLKTAPLSRAYTLLSLGEALSYLGRFLEAKRTLFRAREEAWASGDYRAMGYTLLNLADLYREAGLPEAEGLYREAEAHLEKAHDPYALGLVHLGLARLGAKGSLERARAFFQEGEARGSSRSGTWWRAGSAVGPSTLKRPSASPRRRGREGFSSSPGWSSS